MSGQLARLDPRDLYAHPELVKPAVDQIEKVIAAAAAVQAWREMEAAIDLLIDCQKVIVRWWDDHTRPSHRPSGTVFGENTVPAPEAEQKLGFRKAYVSRWRIALLDARLYRARQIEAARSAAKLKAKDPSATRPQPERTGPDFWPTPSCLIRTCVEHVLPMLPPGWIWECAAGDGRLARAIAASGRDVCASDLYPQDAGGVPRETPELEIRQHDFLKDEPFTAGVVALTNPPYNASDEFLRRGLELIDQGILIGLVLLLRHDHLQAKERVEAFNRTTWELHCNWRPIWIEGTKGQPRWSFHWIIWLASNRRHPPLYLSEASS